MLITSKEVTINEIVPLYYTRQMSEQIFGISKNDLNLLLLRIHSEKNFRGFIFLIFLTLIVYLGIKRTLGKEYTLEEALTNIKKHKM